MPGPYSYPITSRLGLEPQNCIHNKLSTIEYVLLQMFPRADTYGVPVVFCLPSMYRISTYCTWSGRTGTSSGSFANDLLVIAQVWRHTFRSTLIYKKYILHFSLGGTNLSLWIFHVLRLIFKIGLGMQKYWRSFSGCGCTSDQKP